MTFGTTSIVAQSKVMGIRLNGQPVTSAKTTVMPPGQGSSKAQITTGDVLASGTRLIIPAYTVLFLQSPGGRQVCGSTQGNAIEYTIKMTSEGENHTVRGSGAQLNSTVSKTVGYNYRVNNGRGTTSAAKGTEFTFTDMSDTNNESALITTQEGTIHIIDEVPINIGGQAGTDKRGKPMKKSITKVQNQGDEDYYSTDNPVYYNDYSQAINDITQAINAIEDQEERADNLLCLGDLFMDTDQFNKAIKPYKDAFAIYYNFYGQDDLDTLDSQLCYAEALEYSGNSNDAYKILTDARSILEDLEQYNKDDLDYLSGLGYYNDEDIYAICDELADIYDLLGWSYEIEGDKSESDAYYQDRDNACND